MSWLRSLVSGLRALFQKEQVERELDEELSGFMEMAAQEQMRRGMDAKAARREVRLERGSLDATREIIGATGWESAVQSSWQDVRFGTRMLMKNPVFSAVAVLTLAIGIGANTAIFSLIDTVMLKFLPVQNPEQLMVINIANPASKPVPDPTAYSSLSNPLWEQIRDRQDVFSGVFAWGRTTFSLAQDGESQNADGVYVSGDYFNTLGVRPAAGRLITPDDDVRGCAGAAVLSYGFWQRQYGGAPNVIGSVIRLSDHPIQVIGATAPGFFGTNVGAKFDVAVPLCTEEILNGKSSKLDRRDSWWLRAMGRLKPGITPTQATARLEILSPPIFSAAIPPNQKPADRQEFVSNTLVAMPGGRGLSTIRVDYLQPLEVLMLVVGMVLLIACANIASLMLARTEARRKEVSIRLALGATRSRLVRQLLTESILVSCTGAFIGLLFARWGCALLIHFISTMREPVFLRVSLDGRIAAFTAGLGVLTGLLFGTMPALGSTRVSIGAAMKDGEPRDSERRTHTRPGPWIVGSQIALSLVLVVIAGLFLRSLKNVVSLDPGFDHNNVLIISANSSNANLHTEQRIVINQEILERLRALPGAISVSESAVTPVSGEHWQDHFRLLTDNGSSGEEFIAAENPISPGYFATLHSPVLAGRNFDGHDRLGAPLVCIINETMTKKYFPQISPIGRYLLIRRDTDFKTPPIQIVGIVKDAKYQSLREETQATVYLPISQLTGEDREYANRSPSFEIRSSSQLASLARAAEAAIIALNRSVSLEVHPMQQQIDDSLRQEKLLATLSSFFGGVALLLAMIGLYGVLSYRVAQRHKEIGIRLALGARQSSVLRLILKDVSVVLLAGVAAGLGVSWWATRFLRTMLFDLNPHDARIIVLAVGALLAVGFLAGLFPARRATRVDPIVALRYE